jgi:hypothetical protein
MGVVETLWWSLISGSIIEAAPSVLKAAMQEYLSKVKFNEMVQWINEDRSLWEALPDNYRRVFKDYGSKLGKMEWFTPEWVIEAGRESAPSLYSLFIGDPDAQNWLERQIAEIKENIKSGVAK